MWIFIYSWTYRHVYLEDTCICILMCLLYHLGKRWLVYIQLFLIRCTCTLRVYKYRIIDIEVALLVHSHCYLGSSCVCFGREAECYQITQEKTLMHFLEAANYRRIGNPCSAKSISRMSWLHFPSLPFLTGIPIS